ncbi:MAG: zinc transporter [Lentimonas sp.]|jgi:zinc transporter
MSASIWPRMRCLPVSPTSDKQQCIASIRKEAILFRRYIAPQKDVIRERAQVVKDELVNALSDRMNQDIYMLSVMAAIFMPLGFLSGLLGVNVGGIPGSDNSGGFYIVCGVLGLIISLQIVFFKKLKWF